MTYDLHLRNNVRNKGKVSVFTYAGRRIYIWDVRLDRTDAGE